MRRFLLSFVLLFFLSASRGQIMLNEFYTRPAVGEQQFFELYSMELDREIKMDCYSLIVYYDYTEGTGGSSVRHRGFYVLDFPWQSTIPRLGHYVATAGNDPNDFHDGFNIQQCVTPYSNFNWNSPQLWAEGGSLIRYELNSDNLTYTPTGSQNAPLKVDSLFTGMKNSLVGGAKQAIFLFNNGNYVNGFLGGHNSTQVPQEIRNMPPLPHNIQCWDPDVNTPPPPASGNIDWSKITGAENVTETEGSANGYIRVRDGKCGEWVKSSSPNADCAPRDHEHTPGKPNGGTAKRNDGFTLTTQTELCAAGIDFGITGVQAKRPNEIVPNMFPFIVDLYLDNGDGELTVDVDDFLVSSDTIKSASDTLYRFENITSGNHYLLVFRSMLGCIEKIVPTDLKYIEAPLQDFCGSQVDFAIDSANFNIGKNSGFTVSLYLDRDKNGEFNVTLDGPPVQTLVEVSSGSFNLGTWRDNYFVVYDVITDLNPACQIAVMSKPSISEPLPTVTAAKIYTCGDDRTGDIVAFNITGFDGSPEDYPLTIEVWADRDGNEIPDNDSGPLDTIIQNDPVSAPYDQFNVFIDGKPVVLVYRTARGCPVIDPLNMNCAPLPVNLGSFTAVRNRLKVLLKWETLSEQANKGFYVQRSTKGVWENRAFVFSAADGGNSTEPLEYSFNDDNNEKGVSQYRIQQVDMDGKVAYSPIRSVRGEGQATRTIIYPNPSGEGKVNVVFEDEGSRNVIVSDINGRIIRQYRSVVNSLVIDNLDAGMYLLQITDLSTAETSVEKVIIKMR